MKILHPTVSEVRSKLDQVHANIHPMYRMGRDFTNKERILIAMLRNELHKMIDEFIDNRIRQE